MGRNKKLSLALCLLFSALLLLFQNCGESGSFRLSEQSSSDSVANPLSEFPTGHTTPRVKNKRLGLIFGPNTEQFAIDKLADTGQWYYNYSPHPDRNDSNAKYNTSDWANRYGKEFVPMVYGGVFKLDETDARCPLLEAFAATGQSTCSDSQIFTALSRIHSLFTASNKPKYLMLFNEPYLEGEHRSSQLGRNYKMTPWQAAAAMSRLQSPAASLDLTLVSPTLGDHADSHMWFAEFLKRCVDLASDPTYPCDIQKLPIFSYHAYKCERNYYSQKIMQGELMNSLLAFLQNSQGGNYGGVNWRVYLNSRSLWLTETTCNWDSDFQEAQRQGQYIRSQEESCLRSTGQKGGYGSLLNLEEVSEDKLNRYAWWTSYANPRQDTDTAAINPSSVNRITAARLIDDSGNKTPVGRAIGALSELSDLSQVDCRN